MVQIVESTRTASTEWFIISPVSGPFLVRYFRRMQYNRTQQSVFAKVFVTQFRAWNLLRNSAIVNGELHNNDYKRIL